MVSCCTGAYVSCDSVSDLAWGDVVNNRLVTLRISSLILKKVNIMHSHGVTKEIINKCLFYAPDKYIGGSSYKACVKRCNSIKKDFIKEMVDEVKPEYYNRFRLAIKPISYTQMYEIIKNYEVPRPRKQVDVPKTVFDRVRHRNKKLHDKFNRMFRE